MEKAHPRDAERQSNEGGIAVLAEHRRAAAYPVAIHECNAPRCFVGFASKYFVGKEGALSHCFVGFVQIEVGSFGCFGSRSGRIAPELLTKGSQLIEHSFALPLIDVRRWGW